MTGPITVNVAVRVRSWVHPMLNVLQVVAPRVVPRRMQPAVISAAAVIIVRFGVRTEVSR